MNSPTPYFLPFLAVLRDEVEFWKGEADVARAEAIDGRKRLEAQEGNVAGVLHRTAEVTPTALPNQIDVERKGARSILIGQIEIFEFF